MSQPQFPPTRRSRLPIFALGFVLVAFAAAAVAIVLVRRPRPRRRTPRVGGVTVNIVVRDLGSHTHSDLMVLLQRLDFAGIDARVDSERGRQVALHLEHIHDPSTTLQRLLRRSELALRLVAEDQHGLEADPSSTAFPALTFRRMEESVGESGGSARYRSYSMPTATSASDLAPLIASLPADPRTIVAIECSDSHDSSGMASCTPWRLENPPALTNADVASAEVQFGPYDGRPQVMLTLTSSGATRFADVTGANRRRRLAIVVDGRILSMPVIMERIPGGHVVITMGSGRTTDQIAEAQHLADALSGGALQDEWELRELR